MSHVVSRVRTVSSTGGVHTYSAPNLGFGYRQSRFQKSQEFVVEVELLLRPGDKDEIQRTMDDLMQRRRSKQPLEMHSAGSTFKRPPGYFAGTLIDQTGLKGLSCGDAQVSTKHAASSSIGAMPRPATSCRSFAKCSAASNWPTASI